MVYEIIRLNFLYSCEMFDVSVDVDVECVSSFKIGAPIFRVEKL